MMITGVRGNFLGLKGLDPENLIFERPCARPRALNQVLKQLTAEPEARTYPPAPGFFCPLFNRIVYPLPPLSLYSKSLYLS